VDFAGKSLDPISLPNILKNAGAAIVTIPVPKIPIRQYQRANVNLVEAPKAKVEQKTAMKK